MREKKQQWEKTTTATSYSNEKSGNNSSAAVSGAEAYLNQYRILDENDKIARRYSFDDNGGGYLGL